MPEEFFDPSFTQRVVRLLQLRRGRGPAFVSDEIVPVIDLSSLLEKAATELPASAVDLSFIRATMNGYMFSTYVGFNEVAIGAGNVQVCQCFNPAASGVLVILRRIFQVGIGSQAFQGRYFNTALTNASVFAALNNNPGSRAPGVQFRYQVIALAGVPQVGASAVAFYSADGIPSRDLLLDGPVILEPGQGFEFYPCSNAPAAGVPPAPTVNTVLITVINHAEVPL